MGDVNSTAVPSGLTGAVRLCGHQNGWISKFPLSLDNVEQGWSVVSFRDVTLAQCFSS